MISRDKRKGIVIDYRDLYESMKHKPADDYRKLKLFRTLYNWKKNDERERGN